MASYTGKKKRLNDELEKRGYIEKYIPHICTALKDLLGLKEKDKEEINKNLKDLLEQHRGKIEDIAEENVEYDEAFAKIGKEEKKNDEEDVESEE